MKVETMDCRKANVGFGFMLACGLLLMGNMARAGQPVLEFSGNGSYVDLGRPEVLHMAEDAPFTIEGWMKLNSTSTRDMLYSRRESRGSGSFTYMFGFIDGNKMAAYIGHGGSPNTLWRDVDLDPALETGRWYHLAFSFDGETLTFYLDGVPVGSHAFRYSDHPDYQVMIGGYDNGTDIDGFKSDVRVWDHARTAIQIRDFRQRRLTGAEAGLLGYWPLNENDGATVYDVTSNASTGMIVNASWTVDSELSLNYHALFLDRQTGSPLFTNTNDVDVLLPAQLDGYDRYQFTETAVAPAEWQVLDSGTPPTNMVFTTPVPEGGVTLYAWFTNSTDAIPVRVYSNSIQYVRQTADVTAATRDATATTYGEAMPAMVVWGQVDDGSSSSIELYDLWISAADDETPQEDYVTLTETGKYAVTLSVIDIAGNTDEDTAWVTIVDGTEGPAANLWEIPRNQLEARATDMWRNFVPGRALHPTSVWRLGRSGYTLPNSLILNLRGDYPVSGFGIYATSYRPKAYRAYVTDTYSTNPLDWGDAVAMGELPDESAWHTVTFGATQGRYLVLEFTEGYSTASLYVNEVRAYANRPFVLASPRTGDTHYTWTNTVAVANFPVLPDYDRYQITLSDQAPAAQDPDWQVYDPGTPPSSVTFDEPDPEGEVTLHAWFRDSGETLAPVSFPETIEFLRDSVDVEAVASAQVTTHAWGAGMPAVIRAFDLRPQVPPQHEPYLGADSSATIGLHSLTVSCPEDETPERDDIVTLSTPDDYTVTFTATDRAGNRDAIEIETTVGNMVAHVLGKRLTEDWSGPVNTRSWPEAYVARGPHLPLPPKSDWIVGWPQQWLVDYVGGEFLRVNLPMNTPGEGHFDQHQTLFGYIEGSGSKDVDMRVDFRTHSSSGSHNPGLVARFHPNDPGVEDNTRRGYRLYMQQAGPVEIARIVDGSITTLASQSGVVVKAVWMTARFLVERAPNRQTRLRAKVWEVANPEPETWTLDVLDDTSELQTPGLLGIFGHTSSNRRFDFGEFEAIRIIYGSLIKMR